MSSAAPPGRVAERSHCRSTPDARALPSSPGWRPLQRGVRRRVTGWLGPPSDTTNVAHRAPQACSTEVPRSFRVCSDGGHTVHSDVRLRRHTIVCGRRLGLEVICSGRMLKSRRASPVAAGRWVVSDVTRKRSGSHDSIFRRLTAFEFSGATRLSCGAEPQAFDARHESVGEFTRVASAATRG